jgi:hypothetical protein
VPDLEELHHHRHRGGNDVDADVPPEPDQESVGLLRLRLIGALLVLLRLGPVLILGVLVVVISNL